MLVQVLPNGTILRTENGYNEPLTSQDLPAIEIPGIVRIYSKNGLPSREEGPAYIYERSGLIEYWKDGQLHREDGPAIINPTLKFQQWWQHGQLHREDGPAIEGEGVEPSWWIRGLQVAPPRMPPTPKLEDTE